MRPDLNRVPSFYHGYINLVEEDDLMTAFRNQSPQLMKFLGSIPKEKHDHYYAAGKWTIRELIQHMIDGERIFCYRALRFARKDPAPLAGFDENFYGQTSKADKRNWNDLLEEFKILRQSSEILFKNFDEEQLDSSGICNNASNYVLGWGFIIVGHVTHHMKILRERYL